LDQGEEPGVASYDASERYRLVEVGKVAAMDARLGSRPVSATLSIADCRRASPRFALAVMTGSW
jgi:hypothetical protein